MASRNHITLRNMDSKEKKRQAKRAESDRRETQTARQIADAAYAKDLAEDRVASALFANRQSILNLLPHRPTSVMKADQR